MISFHFITVVAIVSALIIGVEAFPPVSQRHTVAQPPRFKCAAATTCTSPFAPRHQKQHGNMILSMQKEGEDDTQSGLSTPLDRPVLAAVDIAALIGFAAVGKASHSADGSLDLDAVLVTAFPFVTSWLLTSPLTGVYTEDSKDGNVVSESVIKTAKGWIVAVPIGIALRGIIKGYVPPVSFAIVTLIATLVILGGSRVLFTFAEDFFV